MIHSLSGGGQVSGIFSFNPPYFGAQRTSTNSDLRRIRAKKHTRLNFFLYLVFAFEIFI